MRSPVTMLSFRTDAAEAAAAQDGTPADCVVNFGNVRTLARTAFRRRVTRLSPARMAQACRALRDATGC